jgi:hypothetical protein
MVALMRLTGCPPHESRSAWAGVSCCGCGSFMMGPVGCWPRFGEAGSASGKFGYPARDHDTEDVPESR